MVWSTSETYTGNVTFINGQPLTVTALQNNFIFDMGDAYYDTSVVLDAFKWSCEGCIPSEIDGCGIEPQ